MSLFQALSIGALAVLVLLELVGWARGRRGGWIWLVRLTLWLSAAAAIYRPDVVSLIAARLGIQRGADLVSYAVALSFLGTSFYFYSRYTLLQQQLTQIVRHIALQNAVRGGGGEAESPGEPGEPRL